MSDKFYQCCYTNASRVVDGKLSSGWQAVCVSPDIPPDAFKACVALLNANSTIQSSMTDERGNVLNQLQVCCDGSYLYLARTQYGLLDRVGRANMFAHAFIFPLREGGVLTDPNHFLTVERGNFRDSEEDASQIPDTLARTEAWNLESALRAAGLDTERYLLLIRSVYLQMSERKAPRPLYVQYDGTDNGLSALLYCIWCGIPHALRRQLSAATASAGDAVAKNLIFSEQADRHDYFVDPLAGKSSTLSPRAQRRVERLGFVDFAPLNHQNQDIAAYFEALEQTAIALGDPGASNDLILKIAYQQLCEEPSGQLDDAALDGRLSDALRTRYTGSERMEAYVAELLREVYARRLLLTDECEASLADWLGHPVGSGLAQAGEQYNIYRFSTLSVPEAAGKLAAMPQPLFLTYSRKLLEERGGAEILDHYFSTEGVERQPPGWEGLHALWDESAFLPDRPETAVAISTRAWELYCGGLDESGQAVDTYARYQSLMQRLLPPEDHETCARSAKNQYWQQARFEQLSPDTIGEYQHFSVAGNEKCVQFSTFLKLAGLLRDGGERAFLLGLGEFARRYLPQIGEQPLQKATERLLQSLQLSSADAGEWASLAVSISSALLFSALLDVRQAVQEGQFERFLERYRTVRDTAAELGLQDELRQAAGVVADSCLQKDSPEHPVPLDVWLAIGATARGNPFSIFDRTAPAILQQADAAGVVAGSELLQHQRFLDYAEAYIQARTEHARTVRRWLGEWRQAERRRQADEKRASRRNRGLGGLLEKGLSLLGRVGRADTTPPEPDNDENAKTAEHDEHDEKDITPQ